MVQRANSRTHVYRNMFTLILPQFHLSFFYLMLTSAQPAISNQSLETMVYRPLDHGYRGSRFPVKQRFDSGKHEVTKRFN